MSKKVCLHNGCKLPLNNRRYLWQLAYILIGLIVLYRKEQDFNFFQLFLFIFPVLIDVSYSALESKIMDNVRRLFLALNIIILGICVLGFMDIMTDMGDAFSMELEVVNIRFTITKKLLGLFMFSNIIVPLLYYGCSPCQKNEETIASVHRRQKGATR